LVAVTTETLLGSASPVTAALELELEALLETELDVELILELLPPPTTPLPLDELPPLQALSSTAAINHAACFKVSLSSLRPICRYLGYVKHICKTAM
jgi:hypothetical protein